MTYSDYINYFTTVAINHKVLAHASNHKTFYEIDMDDVENALKYDFKYTSLLLESPTINAYDAQSDNIRKVMTGAFVILREVEIGNTIDRNLALHESMGIVEDILSKMLNDTRKSRQNNTVLPKINFEPNSIRLNKIGPLWTNHFGYRAQFTLNHTFINNLQLDVNKWNNETKFQ